MSSITGNFSAIIQQFDEKTTLIPDRQQVNPIDLLFIDGSRLVAFEYSYFDTGRTKYSYQWMNADNQLIIRWDNAHEVAGISTSPDHLHDGSEEAIRPSQPMTLENVLTFVASKISTDK